MKKLFLMVAVTILVTAMIPMEAQEEYLLKIGCQDEPKTLNIWKATDLWSMHVVAWFYPALYYREPVSLKPLPDICTLPLDEVYANSPDGLTFTFPLRDDVVWDDGTPLTAYDFKFTYVIITELEIPDFIPAYEDVEYLRVVDTYTIEIKLTKCTPQFEESIIFTFAVPVQQFDPMLEEARFAEVPLQTFLNIPVEKPISAGPFSFDQWEEGAFVKLVTNSNYHGMGRTVIVNGETIMEGPWYDGVLLKLYDTTDAALLDIQKGEIDYIWWNLDPEYAEQLSGNPDITIEKADELGFFYLAPNIAREPFDDLVLRQALVYLVQKDFIVSRVLQGYGGEAHSVVMPAAGDWYNPNVNMFGHGMSKDERVAKATEMLTAAGYTVPEAKYPEGVLLLPDGTEMRPFEILTPPSDYDPMRAMAGVLIQEWWREIGVPVKARSTTFGEIVHRTFDTMTFDWFILGWRIGGTGYPDHLRYFFHSDKAVPDGNNPMSYINPTVDKYLEDLMTLCDRDDLIEASWKAQELIIEEVAYCPLYYRTLNEAHRNDTFTGWFTQLGGIAGSESPRSCLLYLIPITEKTEKALEYEEEALDYEKEARGYEDAGEWKKAAETWEKAAKSRENAAETWENPTSPQRAIHNYSLAGEDWSNAAEAWETTKVWEAPNKWDNADEAWGNAAGAYAKAGEPEKEEDARENQEKAENSGTYCLIVTVLLIAVALAAAVGTTYRKRR